MAKKRFLDMHTVSRHQNMPIKITPPDHDLPIRMVKAKKTIASAG